jgi:hypothetical protein
MISHAFVATGGEQAYMLPRQDQRLQHLQHHPELR